jgi:4-hydroxy-tetrahydrodipicolinate synthase
MARHMNAHAYRWGGHPAKWLAGFIPDIPTPFDADGAIDIDAFAKLCERQIEAGALALVICETAGESASLTPAERGLLIRTAVEISRKRVHVIAGAGSNATNRAVELTKQAAAAGADAILSVVPYYNRPMQEGIHAHFSAVADATALPVILHDCPSRTGRPLADGTLARLACAPQFVGLRDASGDPARVGRLREILPPAFRLLSGDDATTPAFLAEGGDGAISFIANVAPGLCTAIHHHNQRRRFRAARQPHKLMLPLIEACAGEMPAALKYALSLQGLMRSDVRLPLVKLDGMTRTAVADALRQLEARGQPPQLLPMQSSM